MNNKNLLELGLNEGYNKEASSYNEGFYLGRVSVQYKDIYRIVTEEGEVLARVSGKLSYSSNSTFDYPVVGDWVLLDRTDNKNGELDLDRLERDKKLKKEEAYNLSKAKSQERHRIKSLMKCRK